MTHPTAPRRALRTALVVVGTAVLLDASACAAPEEAPEGETAAEDTRVHTNPDGTEVTIPAAPRRVVALAQAAQAAIELDVPLVGVSELAPHLLTPETRESYEELDTVGAGVEINIEQIATLEPDLIVSGIPAAREFDYSQLEEIAPVVVAEPGTPGQWRELNATVAEVGGAAQTHDALSAEYDERVAEISQTYAEVLADRPAASVYALPDSQWQLDYQDAWSTAVAQDTGLEIEAAPEGAEFYATFSYEELDRLNAYEIVLVDGQPDGSPTAGAQELLDNEVFQELEPAQAGQVYAVAWPEAMSYAPALLRLDALEELFAEL